LAYDREYLEFKVEKGSYLYLASLSADVYEYNGGYLGDTYDTFTITIIPNWNQEFHVDLEDEGCAVEMSECRGSNLVTCVDGISNPATNKNANIDYPACYYDSSGSSYTRYWPDVKISCLDAFYPTNGVYYCRFFIGITYDLSPTPPPTPAPIPTPEATSSTMTTPSSSSTSTLKVLVGLFSATVVALMLA
jgi:hypothetical protein